MLDQSIIGVLRSEGRLVVMIQVKVVNAADDGMYALVPERERQGGDERRLAGALDAVEANGERRGIVRLATIGFGVKGSVRGEVL